VFDCEGVCIADTDEGCNCGVLNDCALVCGGDSTTDRCGTCNGDGESCKTYPAELIGHWNIASDLVYPNAECIDDGGETRDESGDKQGMSLDNEGGGVWLYLDEEESLSCSSDTDCLLMLDPSWECDESGEYYDSMEECESVCALCEHEAPSHVSSSHNAHTDLHSSIES
jgi:hypothetical protein